MMPSVAVGAPNVCGTPPPARMPSRATRTSRSSVGRCHGVMSLWRSATPDHRQAEVLVVKPTARSMARLGARPIPSVVSRLWRFSSELMGWVSVGASSNDVHLGIGIAVKVS